MSRIEPRVNVWQPEGFPGFELTRVQNDPVPLQKQHLEAHFVCVGQSGGGKLRYRGETTTLAGLAFNVFEAGEVASGHPLSPDGWSYWACRVEPDLMTQIAEDISSRGAEPHFPSAYPASDRLKKDLCATFLGLFQSLALPASKLEQESRLVHAFHKLLFHCAEPPAETGVDREHRAVATVTAYLRERVHANVTLDELSELTQLSKYYLLRVFQTHMNISPHGYQTSLRIHHAKGLLRRGEPLAQVAVDVGFADQAHFTRQFKRYVAVTPGEYQARCV